MKATNKLFNTRVYEFPDCVPYSIFHSILFHCVKETNESQQLVFVAH